MGSAFQPQCTWRTRSVDVAAGHDGRVALVETALPADLGLATHSHEFGVLCLVVTGGFRESCAGRPREVGPAELVFYPPGILHNGRFAGRGTTLFSIDIPEPHIASVFGGETPGLETLAPPFAVLMFRLWSELRATDLSSGLVRESLVAELATGAATSSFAPRPWLRKAIDILRQRSHEPPSLAELSAEVGVHPSHLARTFRSTCRCTVGDYLRYHRVANAAGKIGAAGSSLSDIAYHAGFSDQSHFGRVFKQIVGVTPGEYRALLD